MTMVRFTKEVLCGLATAADEILPMRDQRVQQNPGYLTIILLTRVITNLGDLRAIDTRVVEKFFTADWHFCKTFIVKLTKWKCRRFIQVARNVSMSSMWTCLFWTRWRRHNGLSH